MNAAEDRDILILLPSGSIRIPSARAASQEMRARCVPLVCTSDRPGQTLGALVTSRSLSQLDMIAPSRS